MWNQPKLYQQMEGETEECIHTLEFYFVIKMNEVHNGGTLTTTILNENSQS